MGKASITGGGENGLYTIQIQREDGSLVNDSAHCTDLTEDLSGNVGLIEIAGDRNKGINIQPGYGGNAAYSESRDGKLHDVPQKGGSQPAEGVYWNWALRAGWQKWRPNYRYGTITAIDYDADTCDVTLEACTSTDTPDHREMNINQGSSLSDVPVDYMDCNAAAFEVGDEVIVEFQNHDWASPKVIGFKEQPKACWWEPWGDALCDNHIWIVSGGGPSPVNCPELPYEGIWSGRQQLNISLTSGIIYAKLVTEAVFLDPYFTITWSPGDETITQKTTFKTKCQAILTNWDFKSEIMYFLISGNLMNYADPDNPVFIDYYSERFAIAWGLSGGPYSDAHYIGDNDGLEMELELTLLDYHSKPEQVTETTRLDITSFYFGMVGYGYLSVKTAELYVDYIDFTEN